MVETDAVISFHSAELIDQSMALRNPTSEKAGSRNRAGGRGSVIIRQPGTLICEPVEVGCFDRGIRIVNREITIADIVTRDDQYVIWPVTGTDGIGGNDKCQE